MQGHMKTLVVRTIAMYNHSKYSVRVGHAVFVREDEIDPKKPPLILLHGFPTSSYDYAPIWDSLSKQYSD